MLALEDGNEAPYAGSTDLALDGDAYTSWS